MQRPKSLYNTLCSYDNLFLAYKKARKHKTTKDYVIDFEKNLKGNLLLLRSELLLHSYKPKPLVYFIVRDPKTRKISKSDFRDRIIHHALCNVIEPIFEKAFIRDSYANRINKGTHKAIERFDCFKRKVSKNNSRACYVLKADIKHYFENVNHEILLKIIRRKIKDERIIWLIKKILQNHKTSQIGGGALRFGMPLGNLTSQFFANVYLNELDQYVKHELKVKYHIRYVDDFVILHESKNNLIEYKTKINDFLKCELNLEIHPSKSYIIKLDNGINFLGFRIFYYHKLIRKSNIRKFNAKLNQLRLLYRNGKIIRENTLNRFEGWIAYASTANTYKYRQNLIKDFHNDFPLKSEHISTKKGLSIKEIAEQRGIKESTVWWHFAKLIEYNQLSVWKILPKEKINTILLNIYNENDRLKDIKNRINNNSITFDEIACVLAHFKLKHKHLNLQEIS